MYLDVIPDDLKNDIMANFQAMTDCYDLDISQIYLNENNWDLEVYHQNNLDQLWIIESSASL